MRAARWVTPRTIAWSSAPVIARSFVSFPIPTIQTSAPAPWFTNRRAAASRCGRREGWGLRGGAPAPRGGGAVRLPPLDGGEVRIELAQFPKLGRPGGWVRGRPAGASDKLVVIRVDETTVAALSAICTHTGCSV